MAYLSSNHKTHKHNNIMDYTKILNLLIVPSKSIIAI